MKSPALFISAALILLSLVSFGTRAAENSNANFDVNKVRFGQYPDKTRLVLELNKTSDFRAFMLDAPYRMVIDLPSFTWKAGAVETLASAGISAVRHGNLKPGISRIVFDMNAPAQITKAFTIPASDTSNPDRLVIDFTNANAAQFKLAQSNIIGNLNTNKAQLTAAPPLAPDQPVNQPALRTPQKPLVIIDPGHGGIDPGAIGANKTKEKDVVLALSLELRDQLNASGQYRVKMTRDNDTFVKLGDRVKFARKHDGDLFVSIHADSLRDKSVSGASFYTLSEKASDAQAAKLAARENKADLIAGIDLAVEDEVVMDILIDLARRNTQNQSKYLANTLVGKFKSSSLKTLRSANRHANFAVLKAPDIPSVLVETGFMSNAAEVTKLNSKSHRRKIAQTLKKGVDAYFKTVKENERN